MQWTSIEDIRRKPNRINRICWIIRILLTEYYPEYRFNPVYPVYFRITCVL
jgi:hypothetical protein